MLEAQRAAFFAELPVSPAIRRDRLRRAALMIEQHAPALCAALAGDQANQDAESAMRTEVAPALAALREAMANVAAWMRPEGGRGLRAWLGLGGDYVEYQPIGVVGIAAPAALPLFRTASILASVLAAGNRVALGFDAAPRLGRLVGELAPAFFDPLELAVAGDLAGADLLVTSEPQAEGIAIPRSGKSPVIVGRSADFRKAAGQVIAAKRVKGGRVPLAPDHLLVPEEREEAIADWLWRAAMQPGEAEALSAAEQDRVALLLDDARARGGEVLTAEPRGGGMPLHIVRHASEDMLVMREEIAGPVLPLRNYAGIGDAIAAIHRRPPPLAIYYFGRDAAERRHVLERTLSSAIAIDAGAVGARRAGMTLNIGEGEAGFRRFSQARHVYRAPRPRASPREGGDDLGGAAPALH